jgi:hypothetical protein
MYADFLEAMLRFLSRSRRIEQEAVERVRNSAVGHQWHVR